MSGTIHDAMASKTLRNPHFRLFAGAFLISFSPVFVRLVSVSPTASGFYRTLFGGLTLVVWLAVSRSWRLPPLAVQLALATAALFFALDLWFWHRSIWLIGPGLSTLLANLQVFFMLVAGIVLFGERPSRIQLFAAVLAVFGLLLVFAGDWLAVPPGYRLGVLFGLATAMSYAGYLLSMRRARRDAQSRLPATEVAVVSLLVAALLGLAALLENQSLMITSTADLGWLLAYGVVAHACGLMLIASSLTEVTAAGVGLALLLQPALSLVWDRLIFGRELGPVALLGVGLTLLAIFLGSQRRV